MAALAALKPAFSADGPVTAGNSSPLNDGAIALLLGTPQAAGDLGVQPLGEVLATEPRIDVAKVNPHGGAIAIGHPLGASMPRVVVDCLRELRRRGGGIGVAAACIGVGQGMAVVVRA
jgi:acetyl-CoA acetyltransferase